MYIYVYIYIYICVCVCVYIYARKGNLQKAIPGVAAQKVIKVSLKVGKALITCERASQIRHDRRRLTQIWKLVDFELRL